MKKIYFTLFALFTASMILAQSPQAFKYQAIARDESGISQLYAVPYALYAELAESYGT